MCEDTTYYAGIMDKEYMYMCNMRPIAELFLT